MKVIAISLTLEGQKFRRITKRLKELKQNLEESLKEDEEGILLVHGFMTRNKCVEVGMSVALIDTLTDIFPNQKPFYSEEHNTTNRLEMAEFVAEMNGTVYTIGKVEGAVAEMVDIYKEWITPENIINLEL